MKFNKQILLTGSNGFIASHLLKRIPEGQINAVDLLENKSANFNKFMQTAISATTVYSSILQDVSTVIHCAARVHVMNDSVVNPLELYREVNTAGTINLAKQAASAGVKRFIFLSSIKANGEKTPLNCPYTNESPLNYEDPYGQSKAEAEIALMEIAKETGMEVVIIRPTLVYGAGVKANFAALMNLVSKGIPLPFGCIKHNKRSLVSVTNLVDLIITCIDHPKAANQVFMVSDNYDISTSEMISFMGKSLSKKTLQISIPIWMYKLAGKILRKEDVISRLTGSLQVDIKHTMKTLDWTPPQSIADAFQEAASAFKKHKGIK